MNDMVIPEAVQTLERALRVVFGSRLQSLVVYGQPAHAHRPGGEAQGGRGAHGAHGHDDPPTRTLAVVGSMTPDDLRACAAHVEAWHDAGLATPLLIAAREFERSLDAFPLEFGAILTDHSVVAGDDPFAALTVDPADVRRACEVQARSHLLHLREGVLETRGRADALAVLIAQSAAAFAGLITSIARLEGHATDDVASAARHVERILNMPDSAVAGVVALDGVRDIPSADAERLIGPYLQAVDRLVQHVDGWRNA